MDKDNGLSLTKILNLRGEGFARLRWYSKEIAIIAEAMEAIDVALIASAERNIDEHQSLVVAAHRLAQAIDGGVSK